MKTMLALALCCGLLIAATPQEAQAQDCIEECFTVYDTDGHIIGNACLSGGQGWNCTAGQYFCMIDLCHGIPEGFVEPDGTPVYAQVDCDTGRVRTVPMRAVTRVVVTEPAADVAISASELTSS